MVIPVRCFVCFNRARSGLWEPLLDQRRHHPLAPIGPGFLFSPEEKKWNYNRQASTLACDSFIGVDAELDCTSVRLTSRLGWFNARSLPGRLLNQGRTHEVARWATAYPRWQPSTYFTHWIKKFTTIITSTFCQPNGKALVGGQEVASSIFCGRMFCFDFPFLCTFKN